MGEQRSMDRVVVLGASVAGLAAASGLAGRAREVVIVERHALSEAVRSVAAHGALPHVLLASGAGALERLSPGLTAALHDRGALGKGTKGLACRWWVAGEVRSHIPDLGTPMVMCSRALLETELRRAVTALPNVTVLDEVIVRGLLVRDGRVCGFEGEREGRPITVEGDLLVDASGRGSRAVEWLRSAGIATPPTSEVKVDVTYVAVDVRRDPGDLGGALLAMSQNSRDFARIAVALPVEGDRWQIVLGGYFGDAAIPDRSGMLEFASTLPERSFVELLEKEWLGEPRRHRFPSSLRRHWERTRGLPAGFVVIGDAVASFNPLYGQGMSSAAMQAEALVAAVDRVGNTRRLPRAVARATARVVANPWRIATGADFIYPATVGRRAPGTDVINRHLERVMRAAAHDDEINLALIRVQQLLAPPASLLTPAMVRRVRSTLRRAASAPSRDQRDVVVESSLMST